MTKNKTKKKEKKEIQNTQKIKTEQFFPLLFSLTFLIIMPGYKNGQKCSAHLPSTGNNKQIHERYVMKQGERHCSLSAMHSGIIPLSVLQQH